MPIPAAFDLSSRVALVTGAGSPDGIGFATARLLTQLGAAVMISATTARIQDRVSELRDAGFDAAGIAGDLTEAGVASGLVSAALEQWGRLDIVVNNAGMISAADPVFESGTVESMDLVTWQAVPAPIAWRASPGASYITGQYLVVDGGNSIAEQRATPA